MLLRSTCVPPLAFAFATVARVFAPVAGFAQSAATTPDSLSAWHLSPAAIDSSCRAAITSAREGIAALVARQPGDRTFDNTLRPVESAVATLARVTGPETFLYQVSPDSAVRDSSRDCSQRVAHYLVELVSDPQIYAAAVQIRDHGLVSSQADRQLIQVYIENGRRGGAGLDSATRARVTGLFQRLNDIQRDYLIALNRDSSAIMIAPADTVGLPAQFRAGLTPTGNGFVVKVNESTYPQYMQNERNAEARKRFMIAYFNRGGQENIDRLSHALVLRDSLGHLLGFPTWAAYQLDGKMAKDPKRVISFLETVDGRLVARAREEVARLAPLARRDGVAVPLAWSDYSFYNEKYRKAHYAVSTEVVRQYFPVDYVVRAVLDIYQQLFGVRFTEISPADAWAPDVRAFSVTDVSTGSPLGRFYLDLFPRPNKYDHFADFTLQAACRLPDGSRALPVTAIVGNWPQGEPGKPALLSHSDVVIFFHEFGHAMAAVLDASPYVTTGSQNYRQDFVEAPSPDARELDVAAGHSQACVTQRGERAAAARLAHHANDRAQAPERRRGLDVSGVRRYVRHDAARVAAYHRPVRNVGGSHAADDGVRNAARHHPGCRLRALDGRLRRGVLRLSLVTRVRAGHVHAIRARGGAQRKDRLGLSLRCPGSLGDPRT